MVKKSKLTLFITFIMATLLMLTVGFGLMTQSTEAMATETVFQMESGASVRLVEGSSGIRFRVKMDETTKEKVMTSSDAGMLIFPQAYLTADVVSAGKFIDKKVQYDNSVDTTKLGLYDYIDVDNGSEGMTVYQAGDGWYANGCITGILEANYNLDFAAIAYYFDGTDYVYASFDADFGRSITQVLSTTYLKDGATYGDAIDAIYGEWFGTETNPIQINDKEEYDAFVNGIDDVNTYEGKYVNIEQNIDLGEGDGSDVTPIPAVFAGTLTANENVKITYKSTNYYVPAAETYTVTQGIYECDFDIGANMYTDKVIRVKRVSGGSSPSGIPSTSTYTTYQKEYFDEMVEENDITSAKGYEDAYNDYFFALNLGFDLEDIAGSYDLTFKVMYNAISGVSYDETKTVYGGSAGLTLQYALTDAVAFSEENANKWIEYKFDLEDVIANQNRHIARFEGEPGYVRLVFCTTKDIANIYVADVQFVKKELEPINLTNTTNLVAGSSSANQGVKEIPTTIADIPFADDVSEDISKEGIKFTQVWHYRAYGCTATLKLDLTPAQYASKGYTNLRVYICTAAYSNASATTLTDSDIGIQPIDSANSGMWHVYDVKLSELSAQLGEVTAITLFTTKQPTGNYANRNFYLYVELV